MSYRIVMIGAGSFFTDGITEGLCRARELFDGTTFVLVDINEKRLELSVKRNREIVARTGANIRIEGTTRRKAALANCHYVVTSFDRDRVETWLSDIEIPARHGVHQVMGENGGPGGQAHALRNITVFMDICRDMREVCPDAWIMNFTNPMSFICTYIHRYGGMKVLGFCHQVHGSMGVVSEMLGFEPGELQVISGGVNHFNWLLDIRRRSTGKSYMKEFAARVLESKYWRKHWDRIPSQVFTREVFETFGAYPIGYDDHICEYVPFFTPREEWDKRGVKPQAIALHKDLRKQKRQRRESIGDASCRETRARAEFISGYPFPRDGNHPYYQEKPTEVMEAFASNKPLYLTSIVIPNHGAIDNLPSNALVDIPAVAVGGDVRGVHVGPLPTFAMELCRRQITLHELLVEAAAEGDRQKLVQSMALDPHVRSIRQATSIADAFLKHYRQDLPQFWSRRTKHGKNPRSHE